jgi:hypothetical protein
MANTGPNNSIDSLDRLCQAQQVVVPPDAGLLLVVTEPSGGITAHVLRLGILTEGRLEEAQMTLYNAIIRERAKLANAQRKHDYEMRHVNGGN